MGFPVTDFENNPPLILSLFPGVGLLDRAFSSAGFCVVAGPDKILDQDIRSFNPPLNAFQGVIGGPPCQDFSTLKRVKTDYSDLMLREYERVVLAARPDWFLLENVAGVPDLVIDGYGWQRFDLNLSWFSSCSRLRHFQFGHRQGLKLSPIKGKPNPVTATAALASDNRSYEALCHIQGLTEPLNLPDFNLLGKKKVIGNGVPLPLGLYLASTIKTQVYGVSNQPHTPLIDQKRCKCQCGRPVFGKALYDSPACRKRAQIKRQSLAINELHHR